MKYMFASDIHGSAHYCRKMLEAFEREGADKLVILGDILYHGPRNPLPEKYDPKTVCELLNPLAERLICVRGNCDAEVDQMVLSFPIMADYVMIDLSGELLLATHGHVFTEETLPKSAKMVVSGHTHVPKNVISDSGVLFMNPGSVTLPKEESVHGYMIYENGEFIWKDLDGVSYMQRNIKK